MIEMSPNSKEGRMPQLITTIAGVRSLVASHRVAGRSIALVPTMGALHDGHLALVRRASEVADVVVVSIFVNPLQFGPAEDLDRYPRNVEADLAMVDDEVVFFAPAVEEVFPGGESETRIVAGTVATLFEGATRPGHFHGMLTVVAKLLNIVQPEVAVFGQKDAQQVHLVRRMITDLNLPVVLDIVDTVREPDGLALSSRNRYLNSENRRAALVLSAALHGAAELAADGPDAARAAGRALVSNEPKADLDYFELVDPSTFLPVASDHRGSAIAIVAARVGTTRLIDNRPITFP